MEAGGTRGQAGGAGSIRLLYQASDLTKNIDVIMYGVKIHPDNQRVHQKESGTYERGRSPMEPGDTGMSTVRAHAYWKQTCLATQRDKRVEEFFRDHIRILERWITSRVSLTGRSTTRATDIEKHSH